MARLTRIRTAVALATRHRVSGLLAGAHASIRIGRSTEFYDLREYVRGDALSDVDWKATARAGELLVKRQVAERRTTLLLAVATGRDLAGMATPTATKAELAVAAAGVLGLIATNHGDRVAMVYTAGSEVRATRPSNREVGLEQALELLEQACGPQTQPTDLDRLLAVSATALRGRGVVAVICDDVDFDAAVASRLRRLVAQHEVYVICLADLDPTLPETAGRQLVGLADGRTVDAALRIDPVLASELRADREQRAARRAGVANRLAIKTLTIDSDAGLVPAVLRLVSRHAD